MKLFSIALLVFFANCTSPQSKIGVNTKASSSQTLSFDSTQLIEDLRFLASDELKGRLPVTPEMNVARAYIQKRFRQTGIDTFASGFLQPFSFSTRTNASMNGVNILGVIKGGKKSDQYIVVTAHYDHIGVRNGNIYNGANDNASGTAALFAITSYFNKNKPYHSIIIAALDAEEQGLQGAKKFVTDPPVPLSKMILNINSDMIGRDANNHLYAVGTYHYPQLKPHLERVAANAPVKLLFGYDTPQSKEDWTSQSDHYQFHLKKIPFIYFGVEDFENHHRHTDKFPTMTLPYFANAVETIIRSIKAFDENL